MGTRRPDALFPLASAHLNLNLWVTRFNPERGTKVGEPYALTQFDSPSQIISPDVTRSDMDVSPGHAVLTMKTTAGSIWMLDNVDR